MTPEQALAVAANPTYPAGTAEAKAQLVILAEILKELRQLCQKINDDMPIEPVRVNVEGAVEVFNR